MTDVGPRRPNLRRPQLARAFLTSAAEAGGSVFEMMEVRRHRSVDTLRGYVRRVDLFKEYAGRRSVGCDKSRCLSCIDVTILGQSERGERSADKMEMP
jgi:hypothetical protein